MHKDKMKLLFLLPVLVLIINCFYGLYASKEIKEILVAEKFLEIQETINVLVASVEGGEGECSYRNEQNIIAGIEYIDNLPQIYAGAYKREENNLKLITRRYCEGPLFEPFKHFSDRVIMDQKQGTISFNYTPEGESERVVFLCWYWCNEYLLMGGTTEYSVISPAPFWMAAGSQINVVLTLLINIGLVFLVVKCSRRAGDGDALGD